MQPYTALTPAGKLRRLRQLAQQALACYDLKNPQLTYHTFDTNLLYRVTTTNGERFILRLAYPGWRTFEDLQSEALWLEALARDTVIPAPRVIPAISGELVLPLSDPPAGQRLTVPIGVPDTWNATLMSWLPGRLLGKYLTSSNLEKMGALFARLHQHGAAWTPPPGFTARRFEHWLSRGEPNRIVGDGQAGGTDALPAPWRDLLERLHHHVEAAYAATDRSDLRVIHCDLWHDNIKLHRGVLHPIDFEDTVWGFRPHDIAMAMLDLLETVGEARYAALLPAFRRGYEALMAWPAGRIEPFQIGRLLWKINWFANHHPQRLAGMVERHLPVFEHYERTGRVIQPPAL
jgi:Ser/Thr protein kinase RdoA (MazF antagonist)